MKLRRPTLGKVVTVLAAIALAVSVSSALGPGGLPLDKALVLVLGLAPLYGALYWERRRRPAVLHFWDDGSGHRLTVRRLRTGEVLARFLAPTLAGAALPDVQWAHADLENVNLGGADLQRAVLCGANLSAANLRRANLNGADLSHATLLGVHLEGADLRSADLRGADFVGRGAIRVLWSEELDSALLSGARYSAATRWPWGFDPAAHGCVLVNEEPGLPIPAAAAICDSLTLPLPAAESLGFPSEESRP
ncbi:MAG: pentapeptide repeat-containing protein [Actinomycetota bacterium]